MYKCPNCGAMHEGYICHMCGYQDMSAKSMLESAKNQADLDLQARLVEAEKQDNRMVSLHLTAFELYEVQAALNKLQKSAVLDLVMNKITLLVEGMQQK